MIVTAFVFLIFTSWSMDMIRAVYDEGCQKQCTQNSEIVCGTDGRSYLNKCYLENAACDSDVLVAYYGICAPVYTLLPGLNFEPVCGSDGNTYSNVAFLLLESCSSKTSIRKIFDGPCECKKVSKCWRTKNCIVEMVKGCAVCQPKCQRRYLRSERYKLVCASDGRTYSAQELPFITCQSDGKITKVHDGACKKRSCTLKECPKTFFSVCGSNTVTYGNECLFENAICLLEGKEELKMLNHGPCKIGADRSIIGSRYDPVCDSDGEKYFDKVTLEIQRCMNKDIELVPCKK